MKHLKSFDLYILVWKNVFYFKGRVVIVNCRFSFSVNVLLPTQYFVLCTGSEVWYVSKIVDLADMCVKLSCILTQGRIKERGVWLLNLYYQVQVEGWK